MIKTPLSTMIGGAFWTPGATILGSSSKNLTQLIKSLFASNEQGFAYDPNDLTTLYQDTAGTVPVTAVGQPVGLMLDKSRGLALGANLSTGITDGWIPDLSIEETLSMAPVGAKTSKWFAVEPSSFYKIYAPISNRTRVQVKNASGVITYLTPYSSSMGANNSILKSNSDSVLMRVYFANESIGSTVTTFEVRKLSGNHAYQTVSASRPVLQRNATTGAYYLTFDGTDDFLLTNTVDFTTTDKVSLFAGVRKLSDATFGAILSSLGGNGTFEMYHPSAAGSNNYVLSASGSTGATYIIANGYVAPHSSVLSAKIDIGLDLRSLSVNGTKFQNSTVDLGTGSFGSYPLFIGRRGGTALPYNGHIYGLIGIGRLTTDVETATLEKLIAKNTGVTLSV